MAAASNDLDVRDMLGEQTTFQGPLSDPAKTALLVVDMVNWQVPRTTSDGPTATPYFVDRLRATTIPALLRLIPSCRELGAHVVFLRVGSRRADYSDVPGAMRGIFAAAGAQDGTAACEVIPELAVQPDDSSLVKPGSGAFTTTDLHTLLTARGIETLLYSGVVTNACVLSTLTAAFDLGYTNYLVTDATATLSQQLQDESEHLLGSYMAELVDGADIVSRLAGKPRAS